MSNIEQNTTELQEILDIINDLPEVGGGEAVQEIFYVDGTFDMQTLTFSTNATYSEIVTAITSGKYVVAKAQAFMGTYNTNVVYLPVTSLDLTISIVIFDGLMQIDGSSIGLSAGLILLAVTVEVTASGNVHTRIKVVSTTEIK